jgi:hypothetical protein
MGGALDPGFCFLEPPVLDVVGAGKHDGFDPERYWWKVPRVSSGQFCSHWRGQPRGVIREEERARVTTGVTKEELRRSVLRASLYEPFKEKGEEQIARRLKNAATPRKWPPSGSTPRESTG